MQLDEKDMSRLWDMLDAARVSIEFIQNMQFEVFLEDRKTRNAVERNLEIIGEAARCISSNTRDYLSIIPWKSMIALRNILAHEYGEIRHDILWKVCKEKLPILIEQLTVIGVDNPEVSKE
jgi:uncharacterized protein with HEPN domain